MVHKISDLDLPSRSLSQKNVTQADFVRLCNSKILSALMATTSSRFFHPRADSISDLRSSSPPISAISTRSILADFASPSLSASHLEPWFRFTFGCLRLLPLLFCFISFCLLSWPTQNDEQPKASEDPSCACTALEHGTLRPRCALSLLRVLCPRRAACARRQRAHVIVRGFTGIGTTSTRYKGYLYAVIPVHSHIRPYYPDSTVSRPICEVKQGQVRLVLAWGTSWEVRMLYIFCMCGASVSATSKPQPTLP